MKKFSGQRLLIQLISVMLIVTLLCLIVCGGFSLYSTHKALVFSSETAMEVYFSGVTHSLEDLEQFCDNMYASGSCFRTLAVNSDSISASQLLQSKNTMRQMISSRITENTGIMVFSNQTTDKYFQFGTSFLGGAVQKESIASMDEIRNFWEAQSLPEKLGWQTIVTGKEESVILTQARRYRDIYLCTMLDLSSYSSQMQSDLPITYVFLTPNQILTNTEFTNSNSITLAQMLSANDNRLHINGFRYILQTQFDSHSGLGLCSIISTNSMWGTWWIYILLLLLSLVIIISSFCFIYSTTVKMVIYPLNKIQEASRQITSGNTMLKKTEERVQEFSDIQDALDTLITHKVLLETERNKQESQKDHALLQYYQLQTRSHFLLNCLKSLYNLISQSEYDKALEIITRFSNHIRYIFHDSLTFVPIKAELAEVNDYFDIIALERYDHILLNKNIDESLLEFPIPPLLIQTFAENFQKHNPQSDKVLCFSILIDRVELDNVNYVRIRMADNGLGYSEETLQQMGNLTEVFAHTHVGIQNLCRRIDILYKGHCKTAFFNLPHGGACSVFYLPITDSFSLTKGNPNILKEEAIQ